LIKIGIDHSKKALLYLIFSALTDLRYRRAYLETSLPAMALLVPLLIVAVPASILLLHYVMERRSLSQGRSPIDFLVAMYWH